MRAGSTEFLPRLTSRYISGLFSFIRPIGSPARTSCPTNASMDPMFVITVLYPFLWDIIITLPKPRKESANFTTPSAGAITKASPRVRMRHPSDFNHSAVFSPYLTTNFPRTGTFNLRFENLASLDISEEPTPADNSEMLFALADSVFSFF